jgi:hypothetical protein
MTKLIAIVLMLVVVAACGDPDPSGPQEPDVTTTSSPDDPVDSGDGDQPIAEPGPVGSIPEPRPPIDGNLDGEVTVSSADLLILESFPIQVNLQVAGEKPTPCHEIFWTVDDDGERIDIDMISQIAADQVCTQVIEEFAITVPLGSWAEESRDIYLNDEIVGSFDS